MQCWYSTCIEIVVTKNAMLRTLRNGFPHMVKKSIKKDDQSGIVLYLHLPYTVYQRLFTTSSFRDLSEMNWFAATRPYPHACCYYNYSIKISIINRFLGVYPGNANRARPVPVSTFKGRWTTEPLLRDYGIPWVSLAFGRSQTDWGQQLPFLFTTTQPSVGVIGAHLKIQFLKWGNHRFWNLSKSYTEVKNFILLKNIR